MTTFSAIPSGDVDPDSPLTTGLVIKLRDNHLAQAEGAAGAPDILGLDFLTEITLSNDATAEFTNKIDSTYDEYIFTFIDVVPVSDAVQLYSQFSTDGGSNYITTNTYRFGANNTTQAELTAPQLVGSSSGEGLSGKIILYNPSGATQRKRILIEITMTKADGNQFHAEGGIENTGLAAIDAIKFYFSAGNLESGAIRMYGRRIQ